MVLNKYIKAMTHTDVEQLSSLARSLGVEVYHTDPEESKYCKSDGSRIGECWIPKTKDIIIVRHRSAGALWNWQNTQFRMKWEQEKEVNHGS